MDMVKRRRVHISRIKETPYIIKFTSPFRSLSSINLSCDASMYRIGAVLAMSVGSEKPIGYVLQTLTQAKNTIHNSKKRVWPAFLL